MIKWHFYWNMINDNSITMWFIWCIPTPDMNWCIRHPLERMIHPLISKRTRELLTAQENVAQKPHTKKNYCFYLNKIKNDYFAIWSEMIMHLCFLSPDMNGCNCNSIERQIHTLISKVDVITTNSPVSDKFNKHKKNVSQKTYSKNNLLSITIWFIMILIQYD